MGKLSNALQGNLNNDKGPGKGRSGQQLDLFLSLSDREETTPRIVSSHHPRPAGETPAPSRPEPEMILPPAGEPPDVSAEVRAVLSDSEPPRPVDQDVGDGAEKPPLRTGIYRRPQRRAAPLTSEPPRPSRESRGPGWGQGIRNWFAGVELNRRMVSLVIVLTILVAVAAFWSACPKEPTTEPGTVVDLRDIHRPAEEVPAEATAAVAENPESTAASTTPVATEKPTPAAVAADWKIAGAETTVAGGVYSVRFTDPVFVSADNISVEGWAALKALAKKLVSLKGGARVVVTGHTDDIPLSRPTPEFRNNADLAEARAKAAMEHLASFARANKGLVFEMRAGTIQEAPYPNDSNKNRRLNRTATVQITPTGNPE